MSPPVDRRGATGLLAGGALTLAGCAATERPAATPGNATPSDTFEYIVVGSGAGGGPLAANLALAGHTVLLLEAGGEDEPLDVQVPAFHALSTEDDALRWSFHVRHYANDEQQRRDWKYANEAKLGFDGVLYPRAGTLGGCTAHNAMIFIYPHNGDWDRIAELTGDPSWRADAMRRYLERMEACRYRLPLPGNPSRHGFDGWLTTNVANPKLLVRDQALQKLVAAVGLQSFEEHVRDAADLFDRLTLRIQGFLDPNDWRLVSSDYEGITFTPLTTRDGRRVGARQRIRDAQRRAPQQLSVRTHALVTRVLLDGSNRAVGVEYLDGPHLYRADPAAPGDEPAIAPPRTVRATREVILAAGAFNTPQILMLSGIGPRDELGRHGIPVRVDLPGVGRNLQDRYEVGVVSAMEDDFRILRGATFRPPVPGEAPDPQFREWQRGEGVYTTNGAIIAVIERSSPAQPDPDLYLFGLAGHFVGYYTGYSKDIERGSNRFTWAVLKGSTKNTAGRVTLRSADPRDTPSINFSYFEEGNDAGAEDLEAVVAGVQRVREIMARPPIRDLVAEELVPGPAVRTPDDIRRYVRDNAWGHHASCSCAIGRDGDPTAVLDSRFGVRGTKGLRVVDASAFPRIPGLFIVSAVYMLAEKASDVILEDARTSPPLPA